MQNVNPIFNLLPDILSSLGAEQVLHLYAAQLWWNVLQIQEEVAMCTLPCSV